MIDLQQYWVVIGNFNVRVITCCSSECKWHGNNLLMEIVTLIIMCFLILLCGDVEVNPGPKGLKACPQCNKNVPVSTKQVCLWIQIQ